MENDKSTTLTDFEFICIIIGSVIGISILNLPSTADSVAQQDGWIGALLGSIYPLYVIAIAWIIIKKYPDTNIMDICKKYFGKFLGNMLNFLFMAQFLYYAVMVLGNGINMMSTYAVWFMGDSKILLLFIIIIVYINSKGLKVLAKLDIFGFFSLSTLMIICLIAFKYGSFYNLQPVFGSGINKIAKATMDTAFSYSNLEIILILHPILKNKQKVLKLALISTFIITFYYTITVISTTLYLGPDIVPKAFWPYFFMSESVRIPVINSFRFVIMLIWPIILCKSVGTEYYMGTTIMKNITGIEEKRWNIYFIPILLILPLLFRNEVTRRSFGQIITPIVTIFNLSYITAIGLLSAIKVKKN